MCEGYKNYATFNLAMLYGNDQKNFEFIIKLIQDTKNIYNAADKLEEITLDNIPIKEEDNPFYWSILYFAIKDIAFDEVISDFKEDKRVKQYFEKDYIDRLEV